MTTGSERFNVEKPMSADRVVEYLENESSPRKLNDCFKSEPVSNNLLSWALRFEKWGVVLACAIVCFSIAILAYNLIMFMKTMDEVRDLGSQAVGGLSEGTVAVYAQSAFGIIIQFGWRTIAAFAVYYVGKVAAALTLGVARRTHCMYVRARMDEYKLRLQLQNISSTEQKEEA